MSADPILESRSATLVYRTPRGPITAVDAASMRVNSGECVAILGRSGSGKSTLLALLAGLCPPTSGEVRFSGRSWAALTRRETADIRARSVGLLLQSSALLPGLRALDNVLLPAVLAGITQSRAVTRATELLEMVGMSERWDAYPSELSGGQQRRVALARALAAEPAVILADEPTGDLDGAAAREIVTLLERIHAMRTTAIVVVTHDPTVAAMADRRFWIERGRCTEVAGDIEPMAAGPSPVPIAAVAGHVPFEPPPRDLVATTPTAGMGGVAKTWLPFLGGIVVSAAGLALVDGLVARKQETIVRQSRVQRRLAEEMAMQDLRADVDDVSVVDDGRATVSVYLQNYRPERPLHVLGPTLDIGIQRDGRWDSLPMDVGHAARGITAVGDGKKLFHATFAVPEGRYDELLRGYLHVRIGATMVVSDQPDGTGDLFERQDAYYVYLRDPRLTEEDIRVANGWGEKASVPLWISMPSH